MNKSNLVEPPDGIIITISAGMLKEKGYRNWLRNFMNAMGNEGWTYWMRQGAKPKHEILYVYLCIGNRVRYRANFVGTEGPCEWIILCGPVVKAPADYPMKGFRGFRYTQKIF
jgi:hypothetical protein